MQFVTLHEKSQNGNLIGQLCWISSNYNMICTSAYSILYWIIVPSSALEKAVPHPSEMWENSVYLGDQKGSLEIEQTRGSKSHCMTECIFWMTTQEIKICA